MNALVRSFAVVLFAFSSLITSISSQTQSPPPARRYAPLVDYHQHLASPAGIALLNRSRPAVEVPSDIAAFLKAMTDHWNDAGFLADLYTEDTILYVNFRNWRNPWIQGNRQAAAYIVKLFDGPFSITPVIYSSDTAKAKLAGYFTEGQGEKARHFGFFYFDLLKGRDGRWRIGVDSRNFNPEPQYQQTISGQQLLKLLDAAGIKQAVVHSDAYWFDAPSYRVTGDTSAQEYDRVRAENDWTAAETARSGGRLLAFCSFNPLADYALKELARCKSSGSFAGVKLHLQMSGVDLHKATDVEKIRDVFASADRLGLPITVHAQTAPPYDAAAAQAFVDKILPASPTITVTIAHLWGGGPFAPDPLKVYADAVSRQAPGTKNLYFDVAEVALVAGGDKEVLVQITNAIRRIGPRHVLFGSDAVGSSALSPEKAAAQFRDDVPLTAEEFAIIAANRLPFVQK